MNRFLLMLFLGYIFLIPVWIKAVSIRKWQLSSKKVAIVAMVIISAGVTIYGFLRPQAAGTSSLSWLGYVALVLYFIASVVSAYFNWPRERRGSEKLLVGNPKGKSTRKNRAYVSIPSLTGSDGDVSVTFHHATFQKMNESKKRYPDPDFGAWLVEQIYTAKKVMAEKRGTFKKKWFCSSCDNELPAECRELKQIEYELKYKDFNPFTVKIVLPSVMCSQCGKISGLDLDGTLNNHLNEAIIAAFKSESIKP